MYPILSKKPLNKDVDQMIIRAPFVARNAKAGHFLIVRVDEHGERIPLTIVDHTDDTVTIIYQKVGYSTDLLGTLSVGDQIHDVVGPLGQPLHLRSSTTILAIAGGVGAAPLYPQLVAYHKQGATIDLILGARSKEHLLLEQEFQRICRSIHISTDDGSKGIKGKVTDVLTSLLNRQTYDHAIIIGPLIMMKVVSQLTMSRGMTTDVSLNPIMIDGTGMCGNCRVSIHGTTYFACIDGPDFPADGINFDELMQRQSDYHDAEHRCRLELEQR
jgi:ferredoxin--NADP+ reductase